MNEDPMKTEEPLREDEARALRMMTLELRDAPPPELDWKRIERGLMAQVTGREAPEAPEVASITAAREASRSSWTRNLGMLAVAAGVVFAIWGINRQSGEPSAPDAAPVAQADPPSEPPVAQSPRKVEPTRTKLGALPEVDAMGGPAIAVSAMSPGTEVIADDEPLRVGISGVVAWTLSPGSAAIVDTTSVPHTIHLTRGRVDAEVNPNRPGQPLEAFAVIAGETRVAVRGTVFSVERKADRVSVSVARGKVAVGATGSADPPHLVVSPDSADFALTSGKRLTQAEPLRIRPQSQPSGESSEAEPARPAPEHVLLTVGEARAKMLGCLQGALGRAASSEPKITVRSEVTVVTDANGDVSIVRFSPPLRPDLQQTCGGMLFGQRLKPAGSASFSIQLSNR